MTRTDRALLCGISLLIAGAAARAEVPVDLSGYRDAPGVTVRRQGETLAVAWPIEGGESGRLVLDLKPGAPLIASMGLADEKGEEVAILKAVDPVTSVTVGSRVGTNDRPPGMSPFNTFFDSPAKRRYEEQQARLTLEHARVTGGGPRATVILDRLAAGSFAGSLQLTVYAGARLVHVEAVMSTDEPDRAFLYGAGLVAERPSWRRMAWTDTEGIVRHQDLPVHEGANVTRHDPVRHRTIVAESDGGAVACFPPPHQFFTPRDYTDNLRTVWSGSWLHGILYRRGFGIRQPETGGGNYAPWFNAPPGTEQRMGVFYLLSRGKAEDALRETLRYTHGDRFPDLPGYRTFTSHWHMAIAVAAMKEIAEGQGRTMPDFVKMFKDMNVNIVHLAEFHGDGHPNDPGPARLTEMKAMFDECRRVSEGGPLFLPGEEANVLLGPRDPKTPRGHWLYLFPHPVYWILGRTPVQPFAEEKPGGGVLYRVRTGEEMARLLEVERGLAWTAHPRIKASNWTPDAYKDEPFFRSPNWLGAAWKAMPADLSRERLGDRSLDLLDDMANWGARKYVLGEVDVFKIDHTHELYGHMNVNYLALDRVPRFDEDWSPILDALRGGRFFVTTGEVLLRSFTVGGKGSGETLTAGRPEVKFELEWTFPMRFAEVVSGDGAKVYRERIDLGDTGPFGHRTVTLAPDLNGRRWARVAAWDVAGDGAFSEPVWLDPAGP